MITLAILLWLCSNANAPAWCYWLLAASAGFKVVCGTIKLLAIGAKLNED